MKKTAIVTGGGHGIGRSIVTKLLTDGCQVAVLESNPAYVDILSNETNQSLLPILCDIGVPAQVENAIQTIGKQFRQVDYIVNNAGIGCFKPLDELTIEEWNRVLSVNLSGMFYVVKSCKSFLSDHSAIVNIASTRALMSEPDSEAYAATKGGIVALTHALAMSLAPKTRVNCISPGWIEVNDYEGLTEADHSQQPVGRVGFADDIAETVSFLLSEKSGFITGHNIIVDGGMTKKMIYD
ncbi:MAG: SDR family oxidoreductase [Tannerella sp.]|jgi:NAD(P)-dependent dehydrogenase (short-subunit alcohol dehydrogenase family)|nr:SDR family oxidoreductase [Tannerella sp.]